MRFYSAMILPIAAMTSAVAAQSPDGALQDLLKTEAGFSAAGATKAPGDALASMFSTDVVLMARGGAVQGREAAAANLTSNPANRGTGANWHAIRSGVSRDGQHGFTMGYLDLSGGDAALAHRRYLAYWVRGADGWRVAAFKQAIRPAEEAEIEVQPSFVPSAAVAANSVASADSSKSLVAAEQAFSDRAQQVGLYKAFEEFGREDAIHMTGKAGFSVGRAAIAQNVGDPGEHSSPVKWSADTALVAPSGDLGVTIGTIKLLEPAEGQPKEIPFFTVWQRDSVDKPWRYIAE